MVLRFVQYVYVFCMLSGGSAAYLVGVSCRKIEVLVVTVSAVYAQCLDISTELPSLLFSSHPLAACSQLSHILYLSFYAFNHPHVAYNPSLYVQ